MRPKKIKRYRITTKRKQRGGEFCADSIWLRLCANLSRIIINVDYLTDNLISILLSYL